MNQQTFKTISVNSTSEIVIEKSKFIATFKRIRNEEEAQSFFSQMKKKYLDASHNCSAYILASGSLRCHDDGEPSGTAGKPILECLKKNGLNDVAVLITRYFGGIKLGTGGLIRAYTAATQNGIKYSGIVENIFHKSFLLNVGYPLWGKVEGYLKTQNVKYEKPLYYEEVSVKFFAKQHEVIVEGIKNLCNGNVKIIEVDGEFTEVQLLQPI
jgi:uncharacterized YigZ family protein